MSRKLTENALRLLDQEQGTIFKPHGGRLTFALAFPNLYRLGMSGLGFQMIYGLLNGIRDVTCERVFLPEPEEITEYERTHAPLFSLESQTPIRDFDVLGFSLAFEMDSLNVLKILDLAGLPLLGSERSETHPLVIAGGPYPTFNPEPLSDFIDAFVIGEAEEALPELVQALIESHTGAREELLREIAKVRGVYVPSLYDVRYSDDGRVAAVNAGVPAPARVERRKVSDISAHGGTSLILTPNAEFSDMLLAEAMRGCGRGCRFCVAGYSGLPPRPRDVAAIPGGDAADGPGNPSLDSTSGEFTARSPGPPRIGLIGSAVFDHPEAQAICERLGRDGREFSVSSIRIESLTPELARMMHEGGQKTITLAPEAGTERLRRVLNKPITDEEIFEAVDMAAAAGIARVKLYFMIGLPGETDEDVDAIAELACRISDRHRGIALQLSASCFVPKPWTPFQWCGMADLSALSEKLRRLKRLFARRRRIQLSSESPREAAAQALLARGDRRVGRALLLEYGVEDAEAERRSMEQSGRGGGPGLLKAAEQVGLDPAFYIFRPRGEHEVFPWDHIDLLVNKSYLWKEYCRAGSEQLTAPCVVGKCARCGVC